MSKCTRCRGTGKVHGTKSEDDMPMSIAMGTALGMGYFPMKKTVSTTEKCTWCRGTGKVER